MRRPPRWLGALLVLGGWASAMALAACVGDEPVITPAPSGVDGGNDTGITTTPSDTGSPVTDSGTPMDTGPAAIVCLAQPPQLFQAQPPYGPFCNGAPANHCEFGMHCCRNLALNTQTCAATCGAGTADIACLNTDECDGGICCGKGRVRTDLCTYAVVEDFTVSSCQGSCSNEFQLCANNTQCSGKTCTPARVLTPEGVSPKSATTVQVGACL